MRSSDVAVWICSTMESVSPLQLLGGCLTVLDTQLSKLRGAPAEGDKLHDENTEYASHRNCKCVGLFNRQLTGTAYENEQAHVIKPRRV